MNRVATVCLLILLIASASPGVSAAPPDTPTIAAGTEIVVRLIDPIDSTKTAAGERFRASVDDPVVIGDKVLVPRDADATVQIVKAEKSSEFSVKLYDITVNGQRLDVVSNYAQVKAPPKGKKYARRTIGLGGLGAAIGGIAGGGTGAAIGAVSGAVLGATTVAATGNKVQLPSETRLSFQLRSPLHLK